MTDTKHPAEVLADKINSGQTQWDNLTPAIDMLRRIPALEAANAAFSARQEWWNNKMVELEAERDQLRAEVEALRADAERYRWLRSDEGIGENNERTALVAWHSGESLDAAIDTARKAAT